ncbi:MAG: hypothetical protein ACXWNJ_18455 [Vulcanimicrobiaceae bacterium]
MLHTLAMLIAAATGSAPLRHVVFTARVDATDGAVAKVHGPSAQEYRPPTESTGSRTVADVTITIDVVGALPDHSLAVQISEAGKGRGADRESVGVTADGDVLLPPGAPSLLPEESFILMMMARDLIVQSDVSGGASWSIPAGLGLSGTRNYHVAGVDGSHLQLVFSEEAVGKEATQLHIHETGTSLYDASHVIPVSASLDGDIKIERADVVTETKVSATYTLKSDSLGGS